MMGHAWVRAHAGARVQGTNGQTSGRASRRGDDARAREARRVSAAVAALAAVALFGAAPHAQELRDPPALPRGPRVLTLEEALALAQAQNWDVKKAEAYREWVRGKYAEERAAALPQLALDASVRRDSDRTMSALTGGLFPALQDARTVDASLTQVLFAWGKVGATVRAARHGIASAEDQLRLYRQAARRDVTAAFYDVLLARELESVAAENLVQKERHQEEARNRYALGTATDYDVLSAEVAVQNARPEVLRAENAVRAARLRLQVLLGPEQDEVDAAGSLEGPVSAPPDYAAALATAWQRRPDIQAQADRVQVYEELKRIARAGDKPRLDFSASYAHKWLSFGPYAVDGPLWSAGVYLKVPLFDGLRTRGQVLEAQSDLTSAQIDLAKLRDQAAVQVRAAVDAVRESGEILAAVSGTESQAAKLLAMAEKGYEYGVKTQLEVEDAALNLRQARLDLARARRDHLVARTNLKWATGTLGE